MNREAPDLTISLPDGKAFVRYESPDVFESLTKEWGTAKPNIKPRSRAK